MERINKVRSRIRDGALMLLPGFPHIPDDWMESKRDAMGAHLTCVDMYFRGGKNVRQIAERFGVTACTVDVRLRKGVKFLFDHCWIVPPVRAGRSLPDLLSIEESDQS